MLKEKLIIIITLVMLLCACNMQEQQTQLAQIKAQNKIRVGTLASASNYYQAVQGEQGFEYELSQAFADYLGVELEIVPFFNLSDMFERLESGDLDLIASGLTYNKVRAQQYRYGPTYRTISQKLVYKQGRVRPREFDDLDGNFTVIAKSSHSLTLQKIKKSNPDLTWQETEELDEEELLQAVIDGEIDYTLADSHTLSLFRRYHPNLSIGFSVTRNDPIAWILNKSKDDSLYALLVPFFGDVKQSNQLYVLEEKYFGHVRQFNYVNTLAYIEAIKETLPTYRPWFEQYAGSLDWRLLAALSYQESMWNPRAKSPTGVRGIMMLTRSTAKQVGVTNRLEPEQNIRGGAKYLAKLVKRIPDRIPQPDRTWLALAAYNVGWGHVNDARIITEQQGASPDKWADVKKRLPLLIKKRYYRKTRYGYARGDVAVKYVDNIRRYYDALVWLDENNALEPEPESEPESEPEAPEVEKAAQPSKEPINNDKTEPTPSLSPEEKSKQGENNTQQSQ
ncbi:MULTISPECIES: membrane-bound lytic murein transglycosylase MltF [Pseudoalteromonas]|uniref:membrane-bound lytic murein transglycosylase MltF n=1 Tax=Pseudoalteromonas TaxID=53246 RepID=UPI0002CA0261|nr:MULTISPECIES: membrane-bound lytic murein transglycosylase MltF [Pseudoalteromonas]MCP4061361.1 membrane-bound lytic murein transglycosylase MltF [Pseudoalteromonas sp.]ENN98032.1 transglycosylase [Pseudoalteromonas agarivorans S816]MDI3244501.1 membrane-bound lytic murein transglycosylase MltF [Pseudoalteromonas agarivorans]TMS66086.1 membrane-bound lytic murein transglycosylase MltF [Pseudoalteromonas sp. S1691]TMS67234.1 membrane-bound lytic murein transglycosylase MltF [Pseudoalteromona